MVYITIKCPHCQAMTRSPLRLKDWLEYLFCSVCGAWIGLAIREEGPDDDD